MTRARVACALSALVSLIASCSEEPARRAFLGGLPGGRKVLVIGVDGLATYVLGEGRAPNLEGIGAHGASSLEATTGDITISGPGWSSLLTGTWRDRHGVTGNDFTANNLGATPDVFTLLHEVMPEAATASLVMWPPINDLIARGADTRLAFDEVCPTAPAPCRFIERARALLSEGSPDLLFLAWQDVDAAGHAHGWGSPQYMAALAKVDAEVGLVLDAIRARPTYDTEEWLIVVSSDHGGSGQGHGLNIIPHRRIPIYLEGPGVLAGPIVPAPQQVDLVPTILYWLLGDLDPGWDLDGKVIGLDTDDLAGVATRYRRPELPPRTWDTNLVYNGAADVDRGVTGAIDLAPRGWQESSALTFVPTELLPADNGAQRPSSDLASGSFDNAFVIGAEGVSTMHQLIDLGALAAAGQGGRPANYRLSARVTGGHSPACHEPLVTLVFADARGTILKEVAAGPTDEAACDSYTFVTIANSGEVPAGATDATVLVNATRDPDAHGFIDDIALVITPARGPGGSAPR